jgi:hypothetical protein
MSADASSAALLVMIAISHGCLTKRKRFSAVAKSRTIIDVGAC